MISIQQVSHTYNGQQQLVFKDWEIQTGEKWLMLGDSGTGKTTLLHILTGLLQPHTGSVIINGQSVYELPGKDLDYFRGRNIGIVFQRPHFINSLTVGENLLIAQYFARMEKNTARVKAVLRSLNMEDKISSYPHELSEGQLQRVSIGRAVINKPALLVADEPTSSLDDRNSLAVMELLADQSAINGATLIISTHDGRLKNNFQQQYTLT